MDKDSEFEELSFEDEFEPEAETMEKNKLKKLRKARGLPTRGMSQAQRLAMALQQNLSTSDQPSSTTGSNKRQALPPSSEPSNQSEGAAASEAETPLPIRSDIADSNNSPRKLKMLSAFVLLKQTGKYSLQKALLPDYLYPAILAEAARTRNEEAIIHLVSTWPDAILNLNLIDIPVENYLRPGTSDGPSVADSIIRGLFYRKRKYCQLQMLILPKDASTGSDLLRHFSRIPMFYLWKTANFRLPEVLGAGRLKEAAQYVEKTPKLEMKRPINYYSYSKDNVRLVIAVPYGVIHWLGRKANISDVHAGLVLQRHSPFVFHFDNLALINPVDTKAIHNILDLIVDPQADTTHLGTNPLLLDIFGRCLLGKVCAGFQTVRKILLKNKRVFRPEHSLSIIASLHKILHRFTGLRGFFTKVSSIMTHFLPDGFDLEREKQHLVEAFGSCRNLVKANFNDQPMLEGFIPAILEALPTPLVKLSLVRCQLQPADVDSLAESRHVNTLRTLRLDYNDLHECEPQLLVLLSRLRVINMLRMQSCKMKYRDCLRSAAALASSTTLRVWFITGNQMLKVRHIKEFLTLCANIASLRIIVCQPLDYHLLLDKVVMQNRNALTDEKKEDVRVFGTTLNLIVL